jgi:hypothetical protein
MTRLQVGACLSLTGRYARFGRQAARGLEAWRVLTNDAVELVFEDDASDPDTLAAQLPKLAGKCDLLLGPYSTQLMRAAGRAMAQIDGVLFNHGGSGDDVQASCPGRIVSVLAPTSRYAQPFIRAQAARSDQAPLWVVRGRGRFGRQVAAGALAAAQRLDLEALEKVGRDGVSFGDAPETWDLFCAGTFEDDVAFVREATSAPTPPRTVCSIAAGVQDFASMIPDPEGIYGIAQWFPGHVKHNDLGPAESDVLATYARLGGGRPDYPAIQAIAAAVVATHCASTAGSTEPSTLWTLATSLDTTTLLGRFHLDRQTGAQTGHTPVLIRWEAGRQRLVA